MKTNCVRNRYPEGSFWTLFFQLSSYKMWSSPAISISFTPASTLCFLACLCDWFLSSNNLSVVWIVFIVRGSLRKVCKSSEEGTQSLNVHFQEFTFTQRWNFSCLLHGIVSKVVSESQRWARATSLRSLREENVSEVANCPASSIEEKMFSYSLEQKNETQRLRNKKWRE